jgi:hypothetical protein
MSKEIDEAAHAPSVVLVGDGPDYGGSSGDGAVEDRVGIIDDEDDADGASVQRFGAEVLVLGRLVGEPELGSFD